ncbi:MAG TPA: biopolymer transporter ExbD [Cyclobacteriaceae bacterium]|nr:biopolymer transporter ExbD [Cyclobacteriaceae bacterium]
MISRLRANPADMNPGSMADIAFLLLTFFMVTTVIKEEEGLPILLPPFQEQPINKPVADHNLFRIQINSSDQLLINAVPRGNLDGLKEELKNFITNNGMRSSLPDSPMKAIVSLKADRGTSHSAFMNALDVIQAAYYEIYSARAGLSVEQYRKLNLNDKKQKAVYDKAREGIPMNISIAEPTHAVE